MSSLDQRLIAGNVPKVRKAGQVVATLDLGATKIACLIVRTTDPSQGGFELLGYGQQSSRGLKNGTVIDVEGLERSIRLAVADAERMAGQQVSSVRLAISGPSMKTQRVKANIEMDGREITQKDVMKLLNRALESGQNEKQKILHAIPFSYIVDGNDGVRDPRGMFAEDLGVVMNLVTMPDATYKNIVLCVSRAHLEVESASSGAVMSAEAVLVDDEMDNGVVCLDMGGGSTGVTVYLDGSLAFMETLQVGGNHVTSDIAQGIGTTLPAAERIKTLNGAVMATETARKEIIDAPRIGDEGRLEAAEMSRGDLVQVIEPRMEETFELISKTLSKSGLGGRLPRRVVLTGGASELPGVRDLASKILAMQARLARPVKAAQLGDDCARPTFATAAGLLTFDHTRGGDPKAAKKTSKINSENSGETGIFGKAVEWLKENF